jgi:succinoglycan biosynthesis protein ExoA
MTTPIVSIIAPFVYIIMPIRNEAAFIERSLSALLMQDYPPERMEVLVVDGMSEDGTRQIVQTLIANTARHLIRLIDNPERIIPTGLNRAIRHARGEVIVRIDGHTLIAPDYISEGIDTLRRTGADNVGGLASPAGEGWIGETIALAYNVRFGVGGALFRRATRETEADTVYMGIFRRDVFDRIGFFDEELIRNQDIELNGRIRRAGGRIILSPCIRSTYFHHHSLQSLWSQNYANGLWLFPTLTKTWRALSWRHYVPLVFVSSLLLSGIASLSVPGGWLVLTAIAGSYLIATAIVSISTARKHGWRVVLSLPIVFVTLHFSYGMGSLRGLGRMVARWLKQRLFPKPM